MPTYRIRDGAYEVPEELVDRSLQIYVAQDKGGPTFTMTVGHSPLPKSEPGAEKSAQEIVTANVDTHLSHIGGTPHVFTLLGRHDLELEGRVLHQAEYQIRAGQITTHTIFTAVKGPRSVIEVLATAPERVRTKWKRALMNLLMTLDLQEGGSA